MIDHTLNYHDTNTRASNPGRVTLSHDKLRIFHPELFTIRTRFLDFIPRRLRSSMRAKYIFNLLSEHLAYGDGRAALVVSTKPYMVATYTDEMDCVAILRFLPESVAFMNTNVGSRLITVNTYSYMQDEIEHPDLTIGPNRLGHFTNFWPIIADFLTDDFDQLNHLKSCISDVEWRRTQELADLKLADSSTKIRYGYPMLSHQMAT